MRNSLTGFWNTSSVFKESLKTEMWSYWHKLYHLAVQILGCKSRKIGQDTVTWFLDLVVWSSVVFLEAPLGSCCGRGNSEESRGWVKRNHAPPPVIQSDQLHFCASHIVSETRYSLLNIYPPIFPSSTLMLCAMVMTHLRAMEYVHSWQFCPLVSQSFWQVMDWHMNQHWPVRHGKSLMLKFLWNADFLIKKGHLWLILTLPFFFSPPFNANVVYITTIH